MKGRQLGLWPRVGFFVINSLMFLVIVNEICFFCHQALLTNLHNDKWISSWFLTLFYHFTFLFFSPLRRGERSSLGCLHNVGFKARREEKELNLAPMCDRCYSLIYYIYIYTDIQIYIYISIYVCVCVHRWWLGKASKKWSAFHQRSLLMCEHSSSFLTSLRMEPTNVDERMALV